MLQQTRGLRVYRGPQASYHASYGDITSEVITAEEELLTNQRLADQVHEQRLLTTIQLVQALGSGCRGSTIYARGRLCRTRVQACRNINPRFQAYSQITTIQAMN